MQLPEFLFILRILFVVLIYLFLMQVVIAITRDLRRAANSGDNAVKGANALGHLVVVDSGPSTVVQPGTRFNLEPQTSIGRGPTNTITITDNFISSEHTRLWYRNGVWYVQDAGSRNGTFVNGQPAVEPISAPPGAIVRVGYIQFKLTQ